MWQPDLGALLADPTAQAPDVVVACAPIHTHAALAGQALRAGFDVLPETPPTSSLAELDQLLAVVEGTGCSVQVGFQPLASASLPALHDVVARGEASDVAGVGAVGTYVVYESCGTRSAWAGRRTVAGRPVIDGVVTNPLAHAVATALHLAGATANVDVDVDVATITLDQYRADAIEVDDTPTATITTSHGPPASLGLTLCASAQTPPHIILQGRISRAVLDYHPDTVTITGPAGVRTFHAACADLLTELLEHRANPSVPLLCPQRDTRAFERVLHAVRTASEPAPIAPEYVRGDRRRRDTSGRSRRQTQARARGDGPRHLHRALGALGKPAPHLAELAITVTSIASHPGRCVWVRPCRAIG